MTAGAWVFLAIIYPIIGAFGFGIAFLDDKEFETVEQIAICAFWPVSLLVTICIGVGRLIGRVRDALPERKPKLPKARARP